MLELNRRAEELVGRLIERSAELRVAVERSASGTTIVDCGVNHSGGLEAGKLLAEICLSGLGRVEIAPDSFPHGSAWCVNVSTDQPVAACMASQYAGWQIVGEKFFAMGSGPMRAAAGKEKLYDSIGCIESPQRAVGILESAQLPPVAVCESIASDCRVAADRLTLLVAPTASQAGTIQVVARSIETSLHKLHELGFDLARIESGAGSAPLPPVAPNDLTGIGWTNDAVLYGGRVTLWVRGHDDELAEIGRQVPSNASADFGEPFLNIFQKYNRDFYKIDPLLFSPAQMTLVNLTSGRVHRFGELRYDVLQASFGLR